MIPRADLETFVHLGDQISHYEAVAAEYRIKMPRSIIAHARLIDQKLADITVCDPAVGSGAFPVGMMSEIVRARSALTPYFNDVHDRTPYHFKRHAIQNCLYGVDIDPGAVEIAKLRLWLSLVVDEEDVKQIKPLPNLDYKIVSGNSLLGVEKNLFNQQLFQKLEKLKPLYFDQSDQSEKAALRRQIDQTIHELTNGKEAFDFEIYFSEVFHRKGGLDVVIMNPPYGAEFSDADKEFLKKKYDHIVERIRNSFLYFMGLGYDIVRKDGIVSTIEPNEFLFQIYMTKARRYFVTNSQILYAINTGEDVFEAIVPTCVVALRKRKLESYRIPVADLRGCTLEELPRRLNTNSFTASSSDIVLGTPNSIFAFDLNSAALVSKLSEKCVAFEAFCDDVANGISTSCDEIYIVSQQFAERSRFEKAYLKPCIRGGQFNRFFCPTATGDFILYVTDTFDPRAARKIYEYLSEHKSVLVKKCVEKKQGKREWHVLFRRRYEELFRTPKVLIRQTADRIVAAPDFDVGYYCIDSVNVALLKQSAVPQLRFLIGLLNSRVVQFYYREISQEGGRVLAQVKPQRIRCLPIPAASPEKQKAVERLVDRILAAKQRDAGADTGLRSEATARQVSALEREIDELVYALYGLTPEEIQIVEGAAK
ncbi:MAG: N-6 DNA methylase [Verrucomicrobia bacterium]|nr:N-6 DNA methylase [Verrucomicrobiota bacterium]